MPARILVVDDDPVTSNWLKAMFDREGYSVSTAARGQTALEQMAQDPPDLVVLDLMLPDMDGLDMLRRVRADRDLPVDPWLVILSVKDRPEDIVAGMNAGADDYVPKRAGADIELISKVRALLTGPRRKTSKEIAAARRGQIFSFCSAKGGTGTTTVCINSACALAELEPHADILVVDMVLPVGTVGASLGCRTAGTVAQLSREVKSKPERTAVDKYVSRSLRWGFRVMLGSTDPLDAASLEANQILPLFDTLRSMFDYILVDFGRTLSRVSLPVLETSDIIVLTLTPDVNTVRLTKLTLDYFESLGIRGHQLFLVDNRTVGRVWISKEEAEQELKAPMRCLIPFEAEHMTMAINAGVPFVAKFPDHAATLMFRDLALMLRDELKQPSVPRRT